MYMYTQGHSRLISTGACIPEEHISSREIMELINSEDRFDVPYDWLERITGGQKAAHRARASQAF